ncbi:hypothetical protein [Vibrio hepatarius]|uniref:hypothetical protein n=1 Tax=Vibrio hepatarius TaxID=171383 RepID=UPI001C08CEA9|nr:hypothetical protein [Vibrio hepatarius]MBU2895631.1 hypothetical protein [Vibrio hepatarius]
MKQDETIGDQEYLDDTICKSLPYRTSKPISEYFSEKPNETKIEVYKRNIKFDVIIVGNEPIISLIVARALSDCGIKVCIINRIEESVGFEGGVSIPSFIGFLLSSLNIETYPFVDKKSFIKTLINHAKKKSLIHYYGENYRVRDFGYDGNMNYFLADISRRKKRTDVDRFIDTCLEKKAHHLTAYLPRALKIKQLIGSELIVNHWVNFLQGWTTEKRGSLLSFITNRPNTSMLFGGDRIATKVKDESQAQKILKEEVEKLVSVVEQLKVKYGTK